MQVIPVLSTGHRVDLFITVLQIVQLFPVPERSIMEVYPAVQSHGHVRYVINLKRSR